jgi:hypothetical protein
MILGVPAGAAEAIEEILFSWGDCAMATHTINEDAGRLVRLLAKFAGNVLKDDRRPPDRWIAGRIDCTNAVEKWRKVATASTISGGIVSLQSCSQ